MNFLFFSQMLMWNVAGIFLVLVLRRHRMRLAASFAW